MANHKTKPSYWTQACKQLSAKDKTMAKIIADYPGETLKSNGNAFQTLANAIVGQQVSIKAAEAIWTRFTNLMPRRQVSYQNFFKLKTSDLKAAGLSKQKILYLNNIADYFKTNRISANYFKSRSSEEIATELLAIKGIGNWTLEMFQLFYLLEPDIFPVSDLGLIKAMRNYYANSRRKLEDKEEIIKLSRRWQPYRTVATWYLWRTIDPDPVAY